MVWDLRLGWSNRARSYMIGFLIILLTAQSKYPLYCIQGCMATYICLMYSQTCEHRLALRIPNNRFMLFVKYHFHFIVCISSGEGHYNGCSPRWLPYPYKLKFRPSCNSHDICYECVSRNAGSMYQYSDVHQDPKRGYFSMVFLS